MREFREQGGGGGAPAVQENNCMAVITAGRGEDACGRGEGHGCVLGFGFTSSSRGEVGDDFAQGFAFHGRFCGYVVWGGVELELELGKMHVEWSGGICTALLWWGMQWRPEIAVPCKSVSGPLSHDLLSLVEVVFFFLIIFSFLFYFWFMRRDY